MKRFIKALTSKTTIFALNIIIQIVLICLVHYYLYQKIVYVALIFRIVFSLVAVFILSIDMSPTFKIPWLTLLLAFPIFGGVLFLLFGNNNVSKKMAKKFKNEEKKSLPFVDSKGLSIQNMDDKYLDHAIYLNNTTHMPVFNNTKTIYLKNGPEYFNLLFSKLKEAKEYIFLEYFIISKGKIWDELLSILKQKISEGVKVYLLYDDIGSSSNLPLFFKKTLRDSQINFAPFNRFTPFASSVHDHRDHRKIVVIDGKMAFTGGINIGDEYANLIITHGKWKDSGIYLEGQAVEMFALLFIQMYNISTKQKLEYQDFVLQYQYQPGNEGYVMPFGDGPSPFDKDHVGEETFINMISSAKKSISITTPYLIVDYQLLQSLKIAAKRGVDVKIITPHIPDKKLVYIMTRNNYAPLIESGVKIYEYEPGFIHAKTCLCDDDVAFVGTINFDFRSLIHHFECGVWLSHNPVIKDIQKDFVETLAESLEIDLQKAKLNVFEKLIRNIILLFTPLL